MKNGRDAANTVIPTSTRLMLAPTATLGAEGPEGSAPTAPLRLALHCQRASQWPKGTAAALATVAWDRVSGLAKGVCVSVGWARWQCGRKVAVRRGTGAVEGSRGSVSPGRGGRVSLRGGPGGGTAAVPTPPVGL